MPSALSESDNQSEFVELADRSDRSCGNKIMGFEKRTVKIILIVFVALIVIGGILGLVLRLLQNQKYIQLEVWPRSDYSGEQSVIQFDAQDPGSWRPWVLRIDNFLDEYRKKGSGVVQVAGADNRMTCTLTSWAQGEKQVCDVPVDDFHPCTPANQYNYEEAAPCVFLRLNKILNWKPEPYNISEDLPQNMPVDLKHHIRMVSGKPEANFVWVSCEGENPADVENIGPVQYIPRRGFPAYYYPFTNKEGYLSPLVAVLFERPSTGVLINIECQAWAKNIQYDRYERRGSVHFKLMVDRS